MDRTPDMSVSPLDRAVPAPLAQLRYTPQNRWVASRFNARTVGGDGRMLLWNTYTGSVAEMLPEHRERALELLTGDGVREPFDNFAQHLVSRGFLVPEGLDEVSRFRMLFGQQHWRSDTLQMILLASEDCNFRCVYCYEKFKNGTMLPEVRQGVRALIDARAPVLRALGLNWFGGEPLYGWDAIEEIAPYAQRVARERGMAFGHEMTTNAYLLTEERATRLLEWGCNRFQITVDGVAEDHDCKRVGRDGGPTWHTIMDNLRAMKARPEPYLVTIRVNYDRDNYLRLGPFIEQLSEDFGGDGRFLLRFRQVGRWGGPQDDQLDTCGTSEHRWVLDSLRGQAVQSGLRAEGGLDDIRLPGSQVCYAARPFNFIVGATGKLMKCTIVLDEMPENIVGQLHPDGRMEVNEANLLKWVAPHYETDSLCQTCYVLPGCQGAACPLTRIRDGYRSCCDVKSELKREMRFTLDALAARRSATPRPARAAPVAVDG
jgi:uncharacterized protein